MKYNLTTTVVIAVIALAAGFFAGTKYQSSKTITTGRGQFAAGATGARGNGGAARFGGGQVIGTILSVDSTIMTVKLQDGTSKNIVLAGSTSINKMAAGTTADLVVGTRVGVFGTTNTDGSVTAANIQLNPAQSGATPSASPSPTK